MSIQFIPNYRVALLYIQSVELQRGILKWNNHPTPDRCRCRWAAPLILPVSSEYRSRWAARKKGRSLTCPVYTGQVVVSYRSSTGVWRQLFPYYFLNMEGHILSQRCPKSALKVPCQGTYTINRAPYFS